jgi:predicted MFS family arabinose efflux permease
VGRSKRGVERTLIVRQSLASLADNLSAPYMGYYFASLSGSGALQGVLQMSVNSLPTVTQVLAGPWLDRTGKHVVLLLAASVASSILWLLVPLTLDPLLLVALITARAVVVGVSGLALTALVGELFPGDRRGRMLSYLYAAAQLSALPVFAAMVFANPSLEAMRLMFTVSGVVSLAASTTWFALLGVGRRREGASASLTSSLRALRNRAFARFAVATSIYNFAMAIAWPLFPLAQRYVLNMSVADLALLNLLSTSSTMVSQYALAKHINGRSLKKLVIVSRAGLVMFPTVYALSHDPLPIFAWQLLSGPFVAIGMVAIPLYAMEVADPELKACYLSTLNLLQGISASLGSALGGFHTDRLVRSAGWEEVRYGLALSAALRAAALIPLLTIHDVEVPEGSREANRAKLVQ